MTAYILLVAPLVVPEKRNQPNLTDLTLCNRKTGRVYSHWSAYPAAYRHR